jgi:predicted PurR-regulated permease PerM
MAHHGSSLRGSRSSAAAAVPPTTAETAETDGAPGAAHPRRRTPLNQMSPLRIGFVGALGVLLAYGLARAVIQAQSILILVVVALFIALGLEPLVRALTRAGLKRGLAVLVVLLGVVAVFALAGLAVVPVFVEQITILVRSAPELLQNTLRNPQVNALDERFQLVDKLQDGLTSGSLAAGAAGGVLGFAGAVLGAVVSAFTVLILSLYFLAALPAFKDAIVGLSPASRRARAGYLTDQIFQRISSYISGTAVVAIIAGVLSYIFLMIIGLGEYALALAVLVAVLDIIPLIGATLAAVVVVIVGFTQSPTIGIACLIFYALYQQFENYVVQPRVFRKAVDVPGALVVIAALIGADGLGKPVVRALNTVNIPMGIEAGLAIVILAIILDRVCRVGDARGAGSRK